MRIKITRQGDFLQKIYVADSANIIKTTFGFVKFFASFVVKNAHTLFIQNSNEPLSLSLVR
jgi:hypothetical protein